MPGATSESSANADAGSRSFDEVIGDELALREVPALAPLIEALKKVVGTYKIGNGMDDDVTHGPVITRKALEDIKELVDDAVDSGASVAAGGEFGEGDSHFIEPTILRDVTDDMRIFKEEIFGPVAPIFKFSTEEEAIEMANDTEFCLAAYMYSKDQGRCWRVAEGIEYGLVGVNETMISSQYIPFGGVKESGIGWPCWRANSGLKSKVSR